MASDKSEHGRSVNQRVTIREVAAKADVALSSVSRALSGHPDVSDEMRKRVKEVADELFVSKRTVDFHLANIYTKLSVTNRLQAFREATRRGLLTATTS